MSIIRATRQKGGSTFPLTSHVSLFFIRSSFSHKNSRYEFQLAVCK